MNPHLRWWTIRVISWGKINTVEKSDNIHEEKIRYGSCINSNQGVNC